MKTTWLAHKWIWSVVVVALFAVGCGEGAAVTTNCTQNTYDENSAPTSSVRVNCSLSKGVLSVFYAGQKVYALDTVHETLTSYVGGTNSLPAPITIEHPDSKTWIYYSGNLEEGTPRFEIILDADIADTTDPGSSTNTKNCTLERFNSDVLQSSVFNQI